MKKAALTFLALASLLSGAYADTVSTVPEGYFTLTVAPGMGTSRVLTSLSFPLQDKAAAAGHSAGVITGLTASSLSDSSAGWTAGQLAQAATPYLLKVTSGTASGRTFLLSTSTANTSTTATLDSVDAGATDLTTLGIATGVDTYQLIPAETILSLFGTPATTGILGATTADGADQVQIYLTSTGWTSYYYNTNSNGWLRVGPPIPSSNAVVRPDAAVLYSRLPATPLSLVLTGRVPAGDRRALVGNSGVTFLSTGWPTDLTLATSGIRQVSGWVTGSSATADRVEIYTAASGWTQYFHNGTNWLRVGPPINSDNVAISAGSAVLILKQGSASGQSVLTQSLPYSLN